MDDIQSEIKTAGKDCYRCGVIGRKYFWKNMEAPLLKSGITLAELVKRPELN